jgi:predicted TIM-barrel fold metal-dependent hydrolase
MALYERFRDMESVDFRRILMISRRIRFLLCAVFFVMAGLIFGQAEVQRQPIIDVHLHSESLANLKNWGPNPVTGKKAPESVEEHIKQTLAEMDRYNIVLGIASGDLETVEQLRKAAPERIWAGPASSGIPGLDIEKLRALYKSAQLRIMGEVVAQYDGLSPSDPVLDPYFALAESLDVPACIHMGMSLPGITESSPKFRVSVGNPLLLEELLNRHPKLRVWIAHMGFPYFEEMIGILNVYPRVYVDTGAIDWIERREAFASYLKALVTYGFEKRIMFGSDQMTWPEAIGLAVETIEKADFLTAEQKRDILYNNAARFLRLPSEQIARHHGVSNK